jgi:chemotaxis protein histidine kinase CheA
MSAGARKTLEKRLGDFLGFDDGVSDVLDHLLTIVSSSDLLDYLEQLLGSKDNDVKAFVQDIERFQKGLPIDEIDFGKGDSNEDPKIKNQPPATAPENKKAPPASTQSTQKVPPAAGGHANKKQSAAAAKAANANTTKKEQSAAKLPNKNNNKKAAAAASAAASVEKAKEQKKQPEPPSGKQSAPENEKKKHAPPPKGKAKRNCGCFGNLHKPLANCLYCGRIACEEEGYDFCAFCGFLMEEVKPPEGEANRCVFQMCFFLLDM